MLLRFPRRALWWSETHANKIKAAGGGKRRTSTNFYKNKLKTKRNLKLLTDYCRANLKKSPYTMSQTLYHSRHSSFYLSCTPPWYSRLVSRTQVTLVNTRATPTALGPAPLATNRFQVISFNQINRFIAFVNKLTNKDKHPGIVQDYVWSTDWGKTRTKKRVTEKKERSKNNYKKK